MGLLDGKVALVTGAARGQGRAHSVRLAQEGADIVAIDHCAQIPSVGYPLATPDDLRETVRQVESLDRRIVASEVDVRDSAALNSALDAAVEQLGGLDIVVSSAGIASYAPLEMLSDLMWDDMIAVNLTGVFRTVRAAVPHIKATGRGGSIVLTSSVFGVKGGNGVAHYAAAKHGVVGLAKSMAIELAPHMIRVNSIHPTSVDTEMIHNEMTYGMLRPDKVASEVTQEDAAAIFQGANSMPIPWISPADVSSAVLWLASDAARYVTGIQLPIDAGALLK
jgi:SDR family mycofactocin-dependent oxidoreductase